ncbi:MAG: pyruvate kinase alpha/beta domain-containing protein [Acidaminococcaceae bacterium]
MNQQVIDCAVEYVKENKLNYIIIASITGAALEVLCKKFSGHIICVTHAYGYKVPGECEFPEALRQEYEARGVRFVTAAHVLSGAERGISTVYKGMYPVEIMAQTLRMFGAGTKVGVECAVMALDAGVIPFGERVVALGGTGSGVDTAIVVTPNYAQRIFATRIHKILCKPE